MKELEVQIGQMATGDPAALEAFYNRTRTAVYGLALSILRRKEDAEDVMHDSYLRVYQGASGYRARGKPMAWLLRITRNLALDKLRGQPARELSLEEEWLPDLKGDFSESSLDRMVLQTVLSRLSVEERQIVILHSVEGFKHREIAQILDMPLGTALSKYHRALSKLRKMLEEEEK